MHHFNFQCGFIPTMQTPTCGVHACNTQIADSVSLQPRISDEGLNTIAFLKWKPSPQQV